MTKASKKTGASPSRTLIRDIKAAIGQEAGADAFAAQAAADARPEELAELTPSEIAANLADFWTYGARRRGRAAQIRIAPVIGEQAAGLDKLEIVQDDAPFLVDSIMGEIADQGLSVRAMVHPVIEVARERTGERGGAGKVRRESMVQVILDPIGPDREAALVAGVKETLADVRAAVDDFPAMLSLAAEVTAELRASGKATEEELAFLTWLEAERFVFLGARTYEYPRLPNGEYSPTEPLYQARDGLGVLRDPERTVLRRAHEPALIMAQVREQLLNAPAVTVAKSNVRSRVHRRAYMDYVGVKRYDENGCPTGEVRFVGLFTAEAYDQAAQKVPLIREKIANVLARAAGSPSGHNEKRLKNIVENHPRDELFQMSEDDLLDQALGILHLYDRPRVRLFERRDPFDRFASILLFVPRDQYDSDFRFRAGEMLAEAYGGRVSAFYPAFSTAPLVRVHYIIGVTPQEHLWPDLKPLEARIAEAARSWEDRFEAAIRAKGGESEDVAEALMRYRDAFPAGYRDRFDHLEALRDLEIIEGLGDRVEARAYRTGADSVTQLRFKLYRPGAPAPLADVLPILENMGLKALAEAGFPVKREGEAPVWVHDFEIEDPRGGDLVFADIKEVFEDAVVAVWSGATENDGFNRLVLELAMPWREAALIRALARYRQQSGVDPSQRVQEEALAAHPGVTRLILDLFRTKFDPALGLAMDKREAAASATMARIVEALQLVSSLDDDRVLRRLALLVGAVKRTNYYQPGPDGAAKPYISFKVASGELADLPAPKPFREIFVWGVNVEGVHLRFGPVARGGLRWSDRRDDFRTEVLGLVKAQQVKNAVIVPVGSKGGFYPKQLPKAGAPDEVRAEAISAYRTFLSGLLDLTDNLGPDGAIVRPAQVIAWDADDPYLVVAADKGTATFSDIANGVALDYGFWLGDAFASGGSAGYDHKVMGITARGAWEAVKRHFRELGKDIQSEPFTVVGCGDMSGDVFGNGMLLSTQTRLIAAFDHRHIFIDPNPDVAVSYAERQRMFALPRSSWDDYDRKAMSKGGGVFPRSLKSISLSPEAREALGVSADTFSPAELINAIIKAPVELFYLGGIGTYVKARSETNLEVGDKANDAIRVNGADLRVKVVGEGANLGLTQAGRIEFAQAGGRVDTDAIDNSAGVDSSDHEVNIKILTGLLEGDGTIATRKKRDVLLRSMTEDVARHVLEHNYDQTLALSLMEMDAPGELEPHARFMSGLEAKGRLDRTVEGLPDASAIAERAQAGRGLTRPELAVLLAYGKLELKREIVASEAPDDPFFETLLERYFPKPLRKYDDAIRRHRLRRDIIATVFANDVINRCGPSFPWRLMQAAGGDVRAFAVGYEAAKLVLDIPAQWEAVEKLDGKIAASGQMAVFRRLSAALRGAAFWLARRAAREKLDVAGLVARYGPGFESLRKLTPAVASPVDKAAIEARVARLTEAGAPEALARGAAVAQAMTTAADLVDLAEASSWSLPAVARIYHGTGAAFGFDRLREAAGAFAAGDTFERTAVRRLIEDLLAEQALAAHSVIAFAKSEKTGASAEAAAEAVAGWAALRPDAAAAARRTLEEIEAVGGAWTFAKLTIANAALRELATTAR